MATSLIQPSLAGGEVSPTLYGRTDLEKYQSSLRKCRNFIVRQYGGVENRPGLRYIGNAKFSDRKSRLIPFQFSTTQTYILEFGDYYFRVWTNGAQVVSGGSPVEVATPYPVSVLFELKYTQSADVLTICHQSFPPLEVQRYGNEDWRTAVVTTTSGPFQNVNIDTGHTITFSVETGSGTLTANEATFNPEHVGRLFYIEHMLTGEIARWETDRTVAVGDQIRYEENYYECTRAGTTGTVAPVHTEGVQVDGWYGEDNSVEWLYIHSGSAIVHIDSVSDDHLTAQATFVVQEGIIKAPRDLQTTPTYKWAHFAWNDVLGYPGTVVYYQQRLIFAGSANNPQTIWCSKTGQYKDFGTSNPLVDDDAITYGYAGRQLNRILHLIDVGSLVVLTSGGEYKVTGDSNGVLTGTGGFAMSSQSQNGCGDVAPLSVASVALYVQQKGAVVRDLVYSFDIDGFQGSDLTLLANHLFTGYQIVDWALAVSPFSVVWCVRNDGTLLGLTYLRDQQIYAWHPHPFGNGAVESVCSVSEGSEDAVYCLVNRYVNGSTRRYVERMQTRTFSDQVDAFFVDAGLTYDGRFSWDGSHFVTITGGSGDWSYQQDMTLNLSGSALFSAGNVGDEIHIPYTEDDTAKSLHLSIFGFVNGNSVQVRANRDVPPALRNTAQSVFSLAKSHFSGLDHLEGQTVNILADADVEPQQTVSGGAVTIENPSAVVHIGLPISAVLETLDVNVSGQPTLLDKKKLINQVSLVVNASREVLAGTDADHLYEYAQRENEFYDNPIDLATGVIEMNLDADWSKNGRITIQQNDPLPLSVLAIIPSVTVGAD
jgi:hypothetical protein